VRQKKTIPQKIKLLTSCSLCYKFWRPIEEVLSDLLQETLSEDVGGKEKVAQSCSMETFFYFIL
jgi:hypothetical protein